MIEAAHRRIVRDREEADRSDARLLELADDFAAILSVECRPEIRLASCFGDDGVWKKMQMKVCTNVITEYRVKSQ